MLVGQTIGSGPFRFEIEQELGSGAMGTVYKATFHRDGKAGPIALKIVSLGLLGNEGAMARFDREANILKQLRHPHIVKLYATGHYRKTPFIAMEFIDGEALDRVLARRGRLTWEEVVAFGKQLADALQYAHEKGIIHRDLKPSNLMLTREGVLKLTDFGIAKDTDVTALTGQNSTIGTAAYMSPEQCKGDRNLTNKSDLYSLGVVFFELLTGKKPFTAETTVDMFLKHVNEEPPRIGRLMNDLPPKLEALILQLMAKDKEERPVDAAWVARILAEVEEDAFARKSAGLDAVTSRRTDKNKNLDGSQRDEADRDAARALRGKKKKKKKKEAAVPFFQQTRVKAAGLLLALGAIGVGVYLGLRPPSAEKLYAAIDAANSPSDKLAAAAKYLEKYGEQPGEQTDKAAAVFRELKTQERENQMSNRFASGLAKPTEADDPEAYSSAWQAIEAENSGRLRDAKDWWVKVKERFPEEAKLKFSLDDATLAKARWSWLAEKRLADIARTEQRVTALRAEIRERLDRETPFKAEASSPEGLAIRGFRLEDFGDRDKAGKVWDSLVVLTSKEPDKREWFLMAAQQRAGIPKNAADPIPPRVARIEKKVDEASKVADAVKGTSDKPNEWWSVRTACREVIDLYEEEGDVRIQAAVKRAKAVAASVPKG